MIMVSRMTPIVDNVKKNDCAKILKQIIPVGSVVNSYAFYDGKLEFSLSHDRRFVNATTTSFPVYNFWMCLMHEQKRLYEMVASEQFKFESKAMISVLQNLWHTHNSPLIRAGLFFIMNRCSTTGLISSGDIDLELLTPVAISKLKSFPLPEHFHLSYIKGADMIKEILETKSDVYNLVPAGNFNYGLFEHGKNTGIEETKIDHRALTKLCKEKQNKVIITYNYDHRVHRAFEGNRMIMVDKYGKETNNKDRAEEIVVANF